MIKNLFLDILYLMFNKFGKVSYFGIIGYIIIKFF